MKAVREWFSRLGGVAPRWCGRSWLGVACGLALAATGCKSGIGSGCLDADARGECDISTDDPADPGDPAETPLECDLTALPDSPRGICVPYVDSGWHTTLARMAYLPKNQLRCPASAPIAGLYGVEIPEAAVEPRRVIGCSVNPFPSCRSEAHACVPFEPDYPACITQSGAHNCDDPNYPVRTAVEEDGLGDEVTICCAGPNDPE